MKIYICMVCIFSFFVILHAVNECIHFSTIEKLYFVNTYILDHAILACVYVLVQIIKLPIDT